MTKSGLEDPDTTRPLGQVIVPQNLGEAVVGPHRYGMGKGIPPVISPQGCALMMD